MEENAIFTEIILVLIRQNTILHVQRHYQCLWPNGSVFVINLTKDDNWAITRPPIFATGYVSFATTFLYQVASTCTCLLPAKKLVSNTALYVIAPSSKVFLICLICTLFHFTARNFDLNKAEQMLRNVSYKLKNSVIKY